MILPHSSDVNNNKRIKESQVHFIVSSRSLRGSSHSFISVFCLLPTVRYSNVGINGRDACDSCLQRNVNWRIERIHFDSCVPKVALRCICGHGQRTAVYRKKSDREIVRFSISFFFRRVRPKLSHGTH